MTTSNVKLLPLPDPHWIGMDTCDAPGPRHYTADQMHAYARANVAHATAPLQAEIEALQAEVAETREFRDKMANAIGNDQLRRFIEKHGEPVPLTIRMQDAEARAERMSEALREAADDLERGQAEIADQVQVTVPADPRAAAEQAIAEAIRRERMAPDDYAPMPDRPVPMENDE